jgi:AcrR family transcriptional regulator
VSGATAPPLTERGRRTRDGLVAAARSVFEARGYAATRMSDVAGEAGVSHGTVYTWFRSKTELLDAVTTDIVQRLVTPAADDPAESEPYGRLAAANRRFFAAFAASARMLAVVEEAASADPRWTARLDEVRQSYVTRAERTLRRLQRQGAAASDVDAALAATALTGMVETMARRFAAAGGPGRADTGTDRSADTVADQVTRLWARAVGLAVPQPEDQPATQPDSQPGSLPRPRPRSHPAPEEAP